RFHVAMLREAERLQFLEGAKAVVFAGSGTGLSKSWLPASGQPAPSVDVLMSYCDEILHCQAHADNERRAADVAGLTGGEINRFDTPLAPEEALLRTRSRLEGWKTFVLST